MKHMKTAVTILAVIFAAAAFAEKQPLSRYQSIIDRQMFGPLPKDFDPDKMPSEVARGSGSAAAERELTQEQEKLQSAVHFSVINVDHDGKAVVGFTDNSDPKAPVHYYMRVGEKQNGWEVREADPEHATMTIVKDDVEVSLTLGDNSGKGGGKTSSAKSDSASPRPGLLGGSLRARRMARRQAEQEAAKKQAADAAAKEAERQAQAEQEKAEREAERAQQRQQLMAIQEELRKAREAKQQQQAESGDGHNDAE